MRSAAVFFTESHDRHDHIKVNELSLIYSQQSEADCQETHTGSSLKHQNAPLHRFVAFFRLDLSRDDEQLVYSEIDTSRYLAGAGTHCSMIRAFC